MDDSLEKLKKGYWGMLSSASFRQNDQREQLFYVGSPFPKAYLVDSPETEIRLRIKLIKFYQWMLGLTVVFCISFSSYLVLNWMALAGLMVTVVIIQKIWFKIQFAQELSKLKMVERGPSLKQNLQGFLKQSSKHQLFLGLVSSIILVVMGFILMMLDKKYMPVSILCMSFFGLSAFVWGYAYFKKS